MYKLIQYYKIDTKLHKNELRYHTVNFFDTKESADKLKQEIADKLSECGITAYEIIATKNINSLTKMLDRDDVVIFRVIKL